METAIRLKDVLPILRQAIINEMREYDAIPRLEMKAYTWFYLKLRDSMEKIEEQLELLTNMRDELQYKILPILMEGNEQYSFRQHDRTFILTTRTHASIITENHDKAIQWIKDIAQVPGAVKESINPKTLTSIVENYSEEQGMDPPEELIRVYRKKYVAVRK